MKIHIALFAALASNSIEQRDQQIDEKGSAEDATETAMKMRTMRFFSEKLEQRQRILRFGGSAHKLKFLQSHLQLHPSVSSCAISAQLFRL